MRRRRLLTVCAAVVVAFHLAASAPASAQPATVTFNQHIAPLLHRACAQCHRPNGAGPFSLVTFADASRRAVSGRWK